MAELHVDLIYEILSRMPVKSLDRFRCVCKNWCKYIDDPNLSIIQVNRAEEEPIPVMSKMHQDKHLTLFRITESKQDEAEAKKDSVLEFECKEPFYDYRTHNIRGSCNGLLYVSEYSGSGVPFTTTLSVIHPLRNKCYELPPILVMESCGLGFDASTNTFKMCVSVFEKVRKTIRTMVHVLGTDSWREITQIPRYLMKGNGVFSHTCLHWLGFHNKIPYIRVRSHEPLPPNHRKKVIRFDISKEEFRLIDPPRKTGDDWVESKLVDLRGEVGLVYNSAHTFSMELWVLKQNDEWVIHCRFDAKPPLPSNLIDIVGLWNNSGDILVTTECGKRLFVYRLKTGDFHQVNLIGWEGGFGAFIHMYRSSLFSVPGMKKSPFIRSSIHKGFNFCTSKKRRRNRDFNCCTSKRRRRKRRIPLKLIYRFLKLC